MSNLNSAPPHPLGPPVPFKPKWPQVIGIITIVFSVFTFLGAIGSLFAKEMLRFQISVGPGFNGSMEDFDAFLAKYDWYFLLGGLANLVLGLLMISGGIALLRLKKVGKPLLMAYSVLSILVALFTIYMTLGSTMIEDQMTAMFGASTDSPEATAGRIGGAVGGVASAVFSMVFPIFLLVWFGRGSVNNDIRDYFC